MLFRSIEFILNEYFLCFESSIFNYKEDQKKKQFSSEKRMLLKAKNLKTVRLSFAAYENWSKAKVSRRVALSLTVLLQASDKHQ